MFPHSNISIIGCGTLGSYVALNCLLLSVEKDSNLEKLFIVDNDCLIEKNFPFLNLSYDFIVSLGNKAEITQMILAEINSNIEIISIPNKYPEIEEIDKLKNSFIIDCRDTSISDTNINVKMNIDGPYGRIIINPGDLSVQKQSEYKYGNRRFYADLLSKCFCRELIFNQKLFLSQEKRTLIYNFKSSLTCEVLE